MYTGFHICSLLLSLPYTSYCLLSILAKRDMFVDHILIVDMLWVFSFDTEQDGKLLSGGHLCHSRKCSKNGTHHCCHLSEAFSWLSFTTLTI